jgi:O-glycosyl hydrolase
LSRFFEAYSASNITFWATTIQNEPTTGAHTGWLWQTMYYTPEMERDFIKNTLGPALATSNIKLMCLDDNRNHATLWADVVSSSGWWLLILCTKYSL